MGTTTGAVNGVAIRAFRDRQIPTITQQQMADLIDVSQPTYSRIEAGRLRNPGAEVIQAIATQLGVPIAAITYPREACPDCVTQAAA